MENEIWKSVTIKGFDEFYEISNFARLRSKSRIVLRTNRWKTEYQQTIGGNILATRTNGTDPHIYATLQHTDPETKKMVQKTVYIHKLVAEAFVPKPNKKLDKVTFKDRDPTNVMPENLLWTNQSYLSTRSMVEHPHNRNKMGNHQRKTSVPTREIRLKVIELDKKGYDVYTIGEMVGRSRSWGYTHVAKILKQHIK